MSRTIELSKTTTLKQGDLWHLDPACAGEPQDGTTVAFTRSDVTIPKLVFDPSSRGTYGFLIKVPTSEASVKLLLEATATNDGGASTVSVVADWRPSNGQLAVNSWRVVN